MSLINKMLQELDRRHARAAPQGQTLHPEVRPVHAARSGPEWFWRVIAALMLVAAVWTLWVVYQMQPRSVATELALRASDNSRRQSGSAPLATAPAVVAQVEPPAVQAPPTPVLVAAPAPEKLAAPIELLRLALTIDTPLAPRSARPVKAVPTAGPVAQGKKPASRQKPANTAPVRVEKRERAGLPEDRAEAAFRRAAQMLERGRVADAEQALLSALRAYHAHQAARQTLIALYIEQGRIDDARGQLEEGLAVNPAYSPFAVALARIHVDQRGYARALQVLDQASAAGQGSVDYHVLRGAVLQRMARHSEAAGAYRLALGAGLQSGASWVGLGISLDALGRRPEAAEAFRRGVASGSLAAEVRAYAEQRVRQLQ